MNIRTVRKVRAAALAVAFLGIGEVGAAAVAGTAAADALPSTLARPTTSVTAPAMPTVTTEARHHGVYRHQPRWPRHDEGYEHGRGHDEGYEHGRDEHRNRYHGWHGWRGWHGHR